MSDSEGTVTRSRQSEQSRLESVISGALQSASPTASPSEVSRWVLLHVAGFLANEFQAAMLTGKSISTLWSRILGDSSDLRFRSVPDLPRAPLLKGPGLRPPHLEGNLLTLQFECDSVLTGDSCADLEVEVFLDGGGWVLETIRNLDASGDRVPWSALTPFDQGRLESFIDRSVTKLRAEGRIS